MTMQPLPSGSVTATVNLQNTSQFFDNLVAQLIGSDSVLSTMVTEINQAISNNLPQVSPQMTSAARNILQNRPPVALTILPGKAYP